MGRCFLHGNGGANPLNFKVVGGTSAPINPSENTIWVNTSTTITSWLFSATEPSTAEPGMVWIYIGTSSAVEFNALKKNGIQVGPISAKQYVSGAWVNKTAKSYQGGRWVDWFNGIFKEGSLRLISGFTCSNGSVTVGNTLRFKTDGNVYAHWYSNEKIDVTYIKTITAKIADNGESWSYIAGNSPLFGVTTNIPTNNNGQINGLSASVQLLPKSSYSWDYIPGGEYSLDVSKIIGYVYLVFAATGTQSGSGMIDVAEINII